MKRSFIELPIFKSRWEALGLNEEDLLRLQIELLADPKAGDVMQGTGGVRVIYVDFEVYEKIYLLTAYTKNEKDDLTKKERSEIKQLIEVLEQQLRDHS